MKEVKIKDQMLQKAVAEGMDEFVKVFIDAISEAVDGSLNSDNMAELNADQITLLAYHYLHEEVMSGGFVQLIHNGYGAFIYKNPTAKAFREWGIHELYRLIKKSHPLYSKYHEAIERDCTNDEFMALFEQFAEFDDFDDAFIENEEMFTSKIAHYIDEHIENFATIENE